MDRRIPHPDRTGIKRHDPALREVLMEPLAYHIVCHRADRRTEYTGRGFREYGHQTAIQLEVAATNT